MFGYKLTETGKMVVGFLLSTCIVLPLAIFAPKSIAAWAVITEGVSVFFFCLFLIGREPVDDKCSLLYWIIGWSFSPFTVTWALVENSVKQLLSELVERDPNARKRKEKFDWDAVAKQEEANNLFANVAPDDYISVRTKIKE